MGKNKRRNFALAFEQRRKGIGKNADKKVSKKTSKNFVSSKISRNFASLFAPRRGGQKSRENIERITIDEVVQENVKTKTQVGV